MRCVCVRCLKLALFPMTLVTDCSAWVSRQCHIEGGYLCACCDDRLSSSSRSRLRVLAEFPSIGALLYSVIPV
eukprot:3149490-Rhodomonas_salina.1